ncbi:unnamed protein product [Tenebrio molitor]|nr:unnamed protein product [Tenebrio molitor]
MEGALPMLAITMVCSTNKKGGLGNPIYEGECFRNLLHLFQ